MEIHPKLEDYLLSLEKDVLYDVMMTALDEMQGYNGNSKTTCIARALGLQEDGSGKWALPKKAPEVG